MWQLWPPLFEISRYATALNQKAYRYRKGSKLQKILCIKKFFENGMWEGAYLSSYSYLPGSAPELIKLSPSDFYWI